MKIVVDADACPVKEEIVLAAKRFDTEVWMVASYDHILPAWDGVRLVQVDRSSQSADLYISNHVQPGDVLITQDIGLASIGLAKKAKVLSFRGRMYSERAIGFMLEGRHMQSRARRAGTYGKGPPPFGDKHRNCFLHTLTKVLQKLQESSSQ